MYSTFNSFIIIIYSSFTQLFFLAFLFKSQNFVEIGYVVNVVLEC